MIFYLLILGTGFQIVRVINGMVKERKQRKTDLESWERFKTNK